MLMAKDVAEKLLDQDVRYYAVKEGTVAKDDEDEGGGGGEWCESIN